MRCRECGDETNDPPFEEWRGYCPDCVVKTFVFPLIPDERLRDLIAMKMSVKIEVAVVGDGEDFVDHLKLMFKDPTIREKIRVILDLCDKEPPVQKVKVNQPVVRNDPRTG